jgi:radical SAM-linked protein
MNGEPGAPRQRWRLVLRVQSSNEPGQRPSGSRGWADSLLAAGLPVSFTSGGRQPRVTPAAALPLGIAGEREIVDVFLAERLPIADVRARLQAALPAEVALVDLFDVWVGAPAAPAAARFADYRVEATGAPEATVRSAVERVLAARSLPRERRREKRTSAYDLRPLVERLEVWRWDDAAPGGPAGVLRMRLRHESDAVGRPEEVMAALAEVSAASLQAGQITRERLLLGGEPEHPAGD